MSSLSKSRADLMMDIADFDVVLFIKLTRCDLFHVRLLLNVAHHLQEFEIIIQNNFLRAASGRRRRLRTQ